ncbi:DUF4361 domain-containing protein [Maribellus sp. YY47]|uniref:BT_3044 domain-containing protein n=1 Tax=Maribellus sp. YY47 TaxID=2929486 RepID=UPI0020018D44|nr:DUF4361 domain-containing protein [Maribellus sp. YY47]MCK3684384.1 DUF1735 domain-containing protein [Maribellus sp. YY47]
MKYTYIGLTIFAFIFGLYSCNEDEVFEKEQYKNVFALVSESDNVAIKYHKLGEESTGFVAASLGGTNPTQKDIVVNLVEDESLIDAYNKTNFDVDVSKYARPLPKDKYDIDSYQFTIPKGEINGKLPLRIRPDGLSPDTTYFISLLVNSFDNYEINPEKNFVLYSVKLKNYWAKGNGSTMYNMRGKLRQEGTTAEIEMPGTKIIQPLSTNRVRIMAGNETYESDITVFNNEAIILEISDDNKVTISPYKNIEVEQIDGDSEFPNIFFVENDGFKTYKTFLLHYRYRISTVTYYIKEELRLEFNEEDENY